MNLGQPPFQLFAHVNIQSANDTAASIRMEKKGDFTDWKDCCRVFTYLRKLLISWDLPTVADFFNIEKRKQSPLVEENVLHFLEINNSSFCVPAS